MKKVILFILSITMVGVLAACGEESASGLSKDKIVIGVTAGPYEKIAEKAKEVAAEDGFEIELKVFTDYVTPNAALVEGDIDANFFQHVPFMNNFKEDRDADIVSVAKTVIAPMGIYSDNIQSLEEISKGGKIALPSDPVNTGRALTLFERAGWITLKDRIGLEATISDITDNPHQLEFVPMDAAQIPRVLDEFTAAAINPNYAIEEGYNPKEDAFLTEATDPNKDELAIVLAVRKENKEEQVLDKTISAFQSDEVKQFIKEEFEGSVVPVW